jgi:hypothetical protein
MHEVNYLPLYSICILKIFLEQLFSFLKAFAMGKYLLKKSTILLYQNRTGLFYPKSLHFFSFTKYCEAY